MTRRIEEAVFVGAAAPAPTLLVSAVDAERLEVEGDDAERASQFASQVLEHYRLKRGARIRVHRALPSHVGLGSGTQLALAVARALVELHGIEADPPQLARVVGRARRSAIGTWTFAGGGLVVEGGRKVGQDDAAPLLARLPFPSSWRCVVAVPHARAGVSGAAEAQAMAQLPSPPEGDVERVAYLVLMGLLPALVEGDVATFGSSLSEIQERTGEWWAPAQGGTFAPGPSAELVRCMREWGTPGVGQSSWGPAVYGILEGEATAARLAERLREALGPGGVVYEGPFRSDGARVWRAQMDEAG
jgi:beta-RFAP synthase